MSCSLTVARGSLYLERAAYDRHFSGLETLVLLRRGSDLLILPVRHAAAGGYLLKLRNSRGDRVVSAGDFFRAQGIADDCELQLDARWSADAAGLVATNAFERPSAATQGHEHPDRGHAP